MLQTPFVHPVVKQIHDRRQLIKVEAVSQSYLWALSLSIRNSLIKQIVSRGGQLTKVVLWAASLGTMDPFPPFRPWDEHTVSKAFFPREWKHSIEFQGLPSSRANIVFPVQLEHLAILSDQAQDCLVSG